MVVRVSGFPCALSDCTGCGELASGAGTFVGFAVLVQVYRTTGHAPSGRTFSAVIIALAGLRIARDVITEVRATRRKAFTEELVGLNTGHGRLTKIHRTASSTRDHARIRVRSEGLLRRRSVAEINDALTVYVTSAQWAAAVDVLLKDCTGHYRYYVGDV